MPALLALARVGEFLRTVDAQADGAVRLRDHGRARLGEDGVAIGVIAVMVRIEDIADRLIGRFPYGRDHVAGFLGEVGVEDDDVILEDDPDIVAAAEDDVLVGGADGRVAEEDAGRDLGDFVELHLRQFLGLRGGNGECERQDGGKNAHDSLRSKDFLGGWNESMPTPCEMQSGNRAFGVQRICFG